MSDHCATESVERLAGVIEAHAYMPCSHSSTTTVSAFWAQCEGCDWKGPRRTERNTPERDHRLHVADALLASDALAQTLAEARAEAIASMVPPGPCWHDSGITWPNGVSPRCELRAGHAGAHECDRGAMGGTAVWTDRVDAEPDVGERDA